MTSPAAPTPTRVHPSAFALITVPFLLIAMIPLAWGARSQWANGYLARHGEVVAGRVVELRYVPTNPSAARQVARGGRASGQSPVVTFTTRSGETRTMVGTVNRYPVPWSVGDSVDVIYDAADVAHADLRTEVDGWMWWFSVWCVVALVPLAIASLPVVFWIRQR